MNFKEVLKPNLFKVLVSLFISFIFLYLIKENISAAGFSFAFFYKAYGFPFSYLIIGDIAHASDYAKSLFLGSYFSKFGNYLFNSAAFALDIILIYLLACFLSMLFKKKTFQH